MLHESFELNPASSDCFFRPLLLATHQETEGFDEAKMKMSSQIGFTQESACKLRCPFCCSFYAVICTFPSPFACIIFGSESQCSNWEHSCKINNESECVPEPAQEKYWRRHQNLNPDWWFTVSSWPKPPATSSCDYCAQQPGQRRPGSSDEVVMNRARSTPAICF